MSIKHEIESNIYSNWQDKEVATWVAKQLPLLGKAGIHSPCPVFSLSFDEGLVPDNEKAMSAGSFIDDEKIVMSGGFEGTNGHLIAVRDMNELKALCLPMGRPIVLLLEPDSYIQEMKKRSPIVNLDQRKYMWSTSGLVHAVVCLPGKKAGLLDTEHYLEIHKNIKPAVWCANVENPHWSEIVFRPDLEGLNLVSLFVHKPEIHASFLNSTRNLSAKELIIALKEYSLSLARQTSSYQLLRMFPPEENAEYIFEKFVENL